MMPNNRLDWIDITKGIAIFLMVCGHTSIPVSISDFIWSFHMPLFFIVSGMLYNPDKADNYKRYVIRKLYTLVVPYFFFLTCDYLYHIAWRMDVSWNMLTNGIQIGAYWFIQVLLVVELLNAILIKVFIKESNNSSGRMYYMFSIIILSLLGYWASLYKIHFPYRLEVVGLASLHYGLGFLFSDILIKHKISVWLSLLLVGVTLVCSQILPRLDMNYNQFGLFIPNVLLAWLGTFSIMQISKSVEGWNNYCFIKRFFVWAGYNSIVIMGLSQPINMSIKYVLEMTYMYRPFAVIIQHSMLWLFLIYLSFLLNRLFPIFIGRSLS